MSRIGLTDGSGRWFDADKAEVFGEETWWDGHNHVSKATGSQFEHERLYRTASGKWVLQSWSNWQGTSESYVLVSGTIAAAWLVTNEHDPHSACAAEYAALDLDSEVCHG